MVKSTYRPLIYAISTWIAIDGALALLLVYPPSNIWIIVRLFRILIGIILLLEARRIRVKFYTGRGAMGYSMKRVTAYIDLLSFIGIWLTVDGAGTGLLNYIYPIILWQLIRLLRVVLGVSLALGAEYLWFRRPPSEATKGG
jgi:hypothetical protein